jgi:class 3 adenylate cyclase
MRGLRQGAAQLSNAHISAAWDERLAAYYRDDFLPRLKNTSGRSPIIGAYVPRSKLGRYLQYWYIANNPYPTGQKYKLESARDGSVYSRLHAQYQAILTKFVLDFGYDNIYLIDNKTADVIYTFGKSPVFGTNLLTGPYADSNAADLFRTLNHAKDQGIVNVVDFAHFAPAQGQPVALAGAPVFDGPDQIGVIFIQFPIKKINRVMTDDYHWENRGMGKTGEVYLVGADLLMRSRSRLLREDPSTFFAELRSAGYQPDEIEQVQRAGTATLAQRVDTTATRQALSGHEGTEVAKDYRGVNVLTSYAPLAIPGLHWVIVAEMETQEAFAPLRSLTREVMISTVIIILLVSALAVVLGRRLVRPIYRLIDGARAINAGNEDVHLDTDSRDEFADLAVAFNGMTQSLKTKTAQIDATERDYGVLLARLLPAPAAARLRAGQTPTPERFDDASILYAQLTGLTELSTSMSPQAALGLLNDLIGAIDDAAERNGVEKLRTLGDSYLAASGAPLGRLDHATRIVDFAQDFRRIVLRIRADRGVALAVRIGIASGPVLGGVVGETRMTYDVWGDVVDLAKAIAVCGAADVIVLSGSCHDLVQDLYAFEDPVDVLLPGRDGIVVWPLRLDAEQHGRRMSPRSERSVRTNEPEPAHG